MPTFDELSPSQLREAIKLSEQIDSLRHRLHSILGSPRARAGAAAKAKVGRGRKPGKRIMSPEGRARIGAAAKARWVKYRAAAASAKAPTKAAPKKKGGITPAGRAKLAASMKASWAARKKNA